ncbi:hypothetical protein DQW77_01780 [Roseovarius sp. TE539]|uniref:hypothetical protein n=1 Tax=Roseovarius sp. TE539 TaxID=2249812 RepID=UPI000DE123BE|nr:hypothetical protein [Roseovarius sp. TE539]RBI77189.1 hypothetical protein DQW77_01780 [Roseovarius sp. TE539]
MPFLSQFDEKVVLIAGAGAPMGAMLAEGYAAAGARVLALDVDEAAAMSAARLHPDRIEPLCLDPLQPHHIRQVGAIWEAEALHVLVHLQSLREPRRPGAVLKAVPAFTRSLQAGLAAARGRVLSIHEGATPADRPETQAHAAAMSRLTVAMDTTLRAAGVRVNALELGQGPQGAALAGSVLAAADYLTGPRGRGIGGVVLPVTTPVD